MDVVVAATGDDEDNLVISLLAKQEFAVPRVIARVNHPKNHWLFNEMWGVDVAVSTPQLLAGLVEEAVSVGMLVRLLQFDGGNTRLDGGDPGRATRRRSRPRSARSACLAERPSSLSCETATSSCRGPTRFSTWGTKSCSSSARSAPTTRSGRFSCENRDRSSGRGASRGGGKSGHVRAGARRGRARRAGGCRVSAPRRRSAPSRSLPRRPDAPESTEGCRGEHRERGSSRLRRPEAAPEPEPQPPQGAARSARSSQMTPPRPSSPIRPSRRATATAPGTGERSNAPPRRPTARCRPRSSTSTRRSSRRPRWLPSAGPSTTGA